MFWLINRNIVLQSQATNTLKASSYSFSSDTSFRERCYAGAEDNGLLKILKYCTDSPARSYQLKFAVDDVFKNKYIKGMQMVGAGIKEISN